MDRDAGFWYDGISYCMFDGTRMINRIALAIVAALAAPGLAQAWQETPLPLMAQDSQAFTSAQSPWKNDVFSRSAFSPLPFALGIAPANTTFTSFTKKLDDKTFVGVRSMSGFASTMTAPGFTNGFGFSATEVKLGYTLGSVRPWMSASFGSLTPNRFGGPTGLIGDPANPMFTGAPTPSFARVSAGFDVPVGANGTLSFGVSVGAVNGFNTRNNGFAYPGMIGR